MNIKRINKPSCCHGNTTSSPPDGAAGTGSPGVGSFLRFTGWSRLGDRCGSCRRSHEEPRGSAHPHLAAAPGGESGLHLGSLTGRWSPLTWALPLGTLSAKCGSDLIHST